MIERSEYDDDDVSLIERSEVADDDVPWLKDQNMMMMMFMIGRSEVAYDYDVANDDDVLWSKDQNAMMMIMFLIERS